MLFSVLKAMGFLSAKFSLRSGTKVKAVEIPSFEKETITYFSFFETETNVQTEYLTSENSPSYIATPFLHLKTLLIAQRS